MHHSRLAGLIIDCQTDDLGDAAEFWAEALGLEIRPSADDLYVELATASADPYVEVQKVRHDSRVHLDIESDDLEAEATRLEALGAKRVATVKTWIVMEAPTGQRFCIVTPQRAGFEAHAHRWD